MVMLDILTLGSVLAFVGARSFFMEQIQAYQFNVIRLRMIWNKVLSGEDNKASLDLDGVSRIRG